ncbi:MAG TPA: SDR family oxidoreductase [Polyangiaceae bacterium]
MSEHFLKHKVVVVTGASSGVGRAISRAAARQGARVALLARGIDGLNATAAEVQALGGESLVCRLDLGQASEVDAAAERIVAHWGGIDVWVNNAMVSVFAPIEKTQPSEYRRVLEVNFLGTVHGTLAALRFMRPAGSGVIVQIGSALAYRSIPLQGAYCASKAAIRGFTDSLRSELVHEESPIRVTTLELPAVNTPQFEMVRNRLGKHARPVGVIYQPEVAARAFLYAVEHPPRELWIGWSTIKAILGQLFLPGLLDRYLARAAWDEQTTDALPPPHRDNLDAPLPGDRGAHGPFDAEAKTSSAELWLRTHARALLFGAAALVMAGFAVRRSLAET